MERWLMALSLAVIPAAAGHSAPALRDDPRIRQALTLAEAWLDAEMAYEAIPGLCVPATIMPRSWAATTPVVGSTAAPPSPSAT